MSRHRPAHTALICTSATFPHSTKTSNKAMNALSYLTSQETHLVASQIRLREACLPGNKLCVISVAWQGTFPSQMHSGKGELQGPVEQEGCRVGHSKLLPVQRPLTRTGNTTVGREREIWLEDPHGALCKTQVQSCPQSLHRAHHPMAVPSPRVSRVELCRV